MAQRETVSGVPETVLDLRRVTAEVEDLEETWREVGHSIEESALRIVHRDSGDLAGTIKAFAYEGKAVVVAGSASIDYARVQDVRTGFLTGPANEEERPLRLLEHGIDNAIRKTHTGR